MPIDALLYDAWNHDKQSLTKRIVSFFINVKDIWLVKLGINVGDEQHGKTNFLRPVLVVKKIGSLFFTIPLTSKVKENYFHHRLRSWSGKEKNSSCILSQAKVLDAKRFIRKIGSIQTDEYIHIKKLLTDMYL